MKNLQDTTEKNIRIRMLLANVRQCEIVTRTGKSKSLVNLVVKGLRKSAVVRKAIADAVGRPAEELWPDFKPSNNNDGNVHKHNTKKSTPSQARKSR